MPDLPSSPRPRSGPLRLALSLAFALALAFTFAIGLALPGPASAVSIQTSDIVVADPAAGLVVKIDPVSGARSSVLSAIAKSVTTRSNVYAVWLTVGFFELQLSDGVSPAQTLSSGGLLGDPVDVTRASRHRAFYIIDRTRAAPVHVDALSGAQSTHSISPFMVDASGIAFDETSEHLFISDSGAGAVHRFEPKAGLVVASYTTGLSAPTDVDVTSSGEVLAVDGGNLLRIDTVTGGSAVVASGTWTRLAVENDGLSAILLDPSSASLDRVDLATGTVTATFSGSPLAGPTDVTIVPEASAVPGLGAPAVLGLVIAVSSASSWALRRFSPGERRHRAR